MGRTHHMGQELMMRRQNECVSGDPAPVEAPPEEMVVRPPATKLIEVPAADVAQALGLINRIRAMRGRTPLQNLPVRMATPDDPERCVLATATGYFTEPTHFVTTSVDEAEELAKVLGAPHHGERVTLPAVLKTMAELFDSGRLATPPPSRVTVLQPRLFPVAGRLCERSSRVRPLRRPVACSQL